jgi:trk system potassium uptake protein TrkH
MKPMVHSPARFTIFSFALMILAGTLLLMLPQAANTSISLIDALFTSASAVCVTGLTVVDTGTTFSCLGQWIIVVLIQAGGLGIMTISTIIVFMFGKRTNLTGRTIIQETFIHNKKYNLFQMLRAILLSTILIEGVGAIIMFLCFKPEHGISQSLKMSIFHSVSAFCNAGFSTLPDSLMNYRENIPLNLAFCFLIILGGIGFPVIIELKEQFPFNVRTWPRLSLHTKIVLSATGILLVSGTILICFMEWHNTLSSLSLPGRVLASFFQAVNTRTSGFNSLPIGSMANETLFIFMIFMFIGASPGSCGGGIKTTTAAAIIILGFSRLKGSEYPQLFNRKISEKSVGKAISIVLISLVIVFSGIFLLNMTEVGDISHINSRGKFLEICFEVISAFGTVGLSTGMTQALTVPGKLIITFIMFIGRLGPLVVAFAVSRAASSSYQFAEENIMIG